MWTPQGLYAKFLLRQPTLFFGEGAVFGLSDLPARRVAAIHGHSLTDADAGEIQKAFRGKQVRFLRRSWEGEPDLEAIRPTVAELEAFRPDVILAVGGGSVIDGAKLCRLFYEHPSFLPGVGRAEGLSFGTRFLALPTLAGSGAEASSAAVYIDRERRCKGMLVCHGFQPEVVVLDPARIRRLPQSRQLPLLMDAMAHMLEGYVSVVENALADILAEEGLRILREELSRPWEAADALRLQYAAYLGGVVQNHRLVGAAHAAAHQLTAIAHSRAVAMLLPATVRTNSADPAVRERYERLSERAGLGGLDGLLSFLEELTERAELVDARAALWEQLRARGADDALFRRAAEDRGGRGSPRPLDEAYWKEWLENIG